METMRRKFQRSFDALAEVFEFIEGFFAEHEIPGELSFPVQFSVEELFTNMVKYSPETGEEIEVELEVVADGLTVSLTDFDVEPFDPTAAKAVDTDKPLEERQPGGLGIHLTKKLVDSMTYEYKEGESRISFTATLRGDDVPS
jgi:anti-sigma regulatory factor (Ser/Thr protein kinase)